MAFPTKAERQIIAEEAVRERFLDHIGPDATPQEQALAERASRLVVAVARLEHAATQRELTPDEMADLLTRSRMLGIVTRRLGIEAAPMPEALAVEQDAPWKAGASNS